LDGGRYRHLLLLQPETQQVEDFIAGRVIRAIKTSFSGLEFHE
jgi:hypothetical protein